MLPFSPLHDGVSDKAFVGIFRSVLGKVMESYDPTAIVLQCGADSLSGDRLGCFNLSARGHADCVRHMLSYCLPTLVLGGGGCATLILERELRAVAPGPA